VSLICRYYEEAMGQSQSPELLMSESPASVRLPTGGKTTRASTMPRRKFFYLVDSLNVAAEKFQRLIEKNDQLYTKLLRGRGVE
jgi:hypothetical protein